MVYLVLESSSYSRHFSMIAWIVAECEWDGVNGFSSVRCILWAVGIGASKSVSFYFCNCSIEERSGFCEWEVLLGQESLPGDTCVVVVLT